MPWRVWGGHGSGCGGCDRSSDPLLQDQFVFLGLDESEVGRAAELHSERFRDVGQFENRVYDGFPEALAALVAAPVQVAVATYWRHARRHPAHEGRHHRVHAHDTGRVPEGLLQAERR